MRVPWPTHGLWRHADFLRLWAAQVGSAFGSRITRTVLPIIAILTLGASPTEVAVLSVMGVAPGVLIGLFVGGTVDRRSKRPLLIGADLLRAALIFTVPLAAWWGVLSMWQLCVVAALVGAATTLFQIADSSYLPTLVGADRVLEGNAKLEATDSVAEAGGPALAGVLVQLLSAPMALVIDGVSYLFSAAMLARIRTREAPAVASEEQPTVWADIAAGFRVCMSHPLVRAMLLAEGVMAFFGGFFMALYMVLTLQALALSPAMVGLVIGVGGIGGLAGALLAAPLRRWMGATQALLLCMALGEAAGLLVPWSLHAGTLAVPVLIVHQFIGDALLTMFLIQAVSLRQQILPSGVLGRASASFHVVTGALLPAGALVAGPLATVVGLPATLWVGAIGGLLGVPVLWLAMRSMPSQPLPT
jgi:predicted MFS family arabinose efflux permease